MSILDSKAFKQSLHIFWTGIADVVRVCEQKKRFVEFETGSDLKTAVEKLDGREFKGSRVICTQDVGNPLVSPLPDGLVLIYLPDSIPGGPPIP